MFFSNIEIHMQILSSEMSNSSLFILNGKSQMKHLLLANLLGLQFCIGLLFR